MTHGLKMRRWTAASWVTMGVTLVFFLSGYATPGWVYSSQLYKHDSLGLWQHCSTWSDLDSCVNIVDKLNGDPNWLNATRALMTLAAITLIVAIVFFAGTFCCEACGRKCLLGCQAILLIIACGLTFAAVVIYGVERDYPHSHLSYSWYCSVVGCGGCFLAAIFTILDVCQNDYKY